MTIRLLLGPVIVEYFATIAAATVVGVVLFFLPLKNIHARMIAEKTRLKAELEDRVVQAISGTADSVPIGGRQPRADLAGAVTGLKNVLTLGLAERRLETLAVWPFDTRILGKLSAVVLSVVAGLIINILVKKVLKL